MKYNIVYKNIQLGGLNKQGDKYLLDGNFNDVNKGNFEFWTTKNIDHNIVELDYKLKNLPISGEVYKVIKCESNIWEKWEIIKYFTYKSRSYVLIKNDSLQYLVYKSNSGMLWHLLQKIGHGNYNKVTECGLYSTSYIIDLNLQKKLCNIEGEWEELSEKDFKKVLKKVRKTLHNHMYSSSDNLDDAATSSKLSDDKDNYIDSLESVTIKCYINNPYIVFNKLLENLKNKKVVNCGNLEEKKYYKIKDYTTNTSELYKSYRDIINEEMGNLFDDMQNEKFLYECYSNEINIFHGSETVKIKYKVYKRNIKDKKGNIFDLIYTRYNWVKPPNGMNISDDYVIPLFVTRCNNIHKDVPMYNKVAATGLYTCKAFEYVSQIVGNDHVYSVWVGTKYQYYFLGEYLNNLWPFNL